MVLVVGATGLLGSEVCRRLIARGLPVRALVRPTADVARIDQLRALGATLVVGDLRDRESLDAACRGTTTVISTATSLIPHQEGDSIADADRDGQMELVDAARAAGVGQFIYISYSGNHAVPSPLYAAKRGVEQHLRESGVPYTILRPAPFMEIWFSPALGFDYGRGAAQIYGAGERPVSWISLADVAQFAVDCVGNPAAENAVIELGGPEAVSPLEAVRTFEEVTGRRFELQYVPEPALAAQWESAEDPTQKSFAALTLGVARGDAIDMRHTLETFPRRLTSVRDYAASTTSPPAA